MNENTVQFIPKSATFVIDFERHGFQRGDSGTADILNVLASLFLCASRLHAVALQATSAQAALAAAAGRAGVWLCGKTAFSKNKKGNDRPCQDPFISLC